MNAQQITLVQDSFAKVVPIADQAAAMFYSKLFEMDPELKPLFKGDMKEQGQKLMKMIGMAVNSLGRLDEIVPAVQQLGVRHAGYGVKDSDYDTVGGALLWTLEQGLGENFTPDCKAAWTETYTVLATTMKDATKAPA
ncbi:hemin receptor [Marinobacter salinisoli]|uniref:Hemin receptor n=1 Tax=Marinobacter salinisoli TaxID=2769486 RepID=A0ABX7MP42_9GAMM|nr:globin family protein [Marinobacter salinisoli]QSP94065.1 hemin receptor [Marinobacter salinisoli]